MEKNTKKFQNNLPKELFILVLVTEMFLLVGGVNAAPQTVTTYESIGLYWSPSGGSANNIALVRYKEQGASQWKEALPLWYNSTDKEYRGSIVQLKPDTSYTVNLTLKDNGFSELINAKTWSEDYPVAQTIELPAFSGEKINISTSGTPGGYILYTGTNGQEAVIDVNRNEEECVEVSASYVILRNLKIRNCTKHGINLINNARDVIIEDSDISGWGSNLTDGWGRNLDAAIYSPSDSPVERITIQRNKLHHPYSDSNSWNETRPNTCSSNSPCHPSGPQGIVLRSSKGNHVIRYNEIYSDWDHMFNDGMGEVNNCGIGFPNRDSDIYSNYVSNAWDDGIESEGSNMNVRIWGNYIDKTPVKLGIAPVVKGPLYVWRNIAGTSRKDNNPNSDDTDRGPFVKERAPSAMPSCGSNSNGSKIYILHNTILQESPPAGFTYPLGCSSGIEGSAENIESKNNILQIYKTWWKSVDDSSSSLTNSFDYDLYNGVIAAAPGSESHGIRGIPIYSQAPKLNLLTGEGIFTLSQSSPGFDDGVLIPNFNDDYMGSAPDIGTHEAGSPPMLIGTKGFKWRPLPPAGLTVR